MLNKIYVRIPADAESTADPRNFVCGHVAAVDGFQKTATVRIYDPFNTLQYFEDLPHGEVEIPLNNVVHCTLFLGSQVVVNLERCRVLSLVPPSEKGGYYFYYVQNERSKEILKVCEKDIMAAFNNGRIDPSAQLRRYEFQNPAWYFGHAIVSKSMNLLENSIFGFKELAGSKIYLLPHQINTIMRCLQESPCRYMLADEVGMGKTVEAISVLKVYLQNKSDAKVLIVVPKTLKEQWLGELLLKFNIDIENSRNRNQILVRSIDELDLTVCAIQWNFLIVDEVHRYLNDRRAFNLLHGVSKVAENVLLLSATPVQQRKEEYLDLLRLLIPQKYDEIDIKSFGALVSKQGSVIQKTALILDNLSDYEEEIESASAADENPHESEDCQELFEEIQDDLEEICDRIEDPKLKELFATINFEDDDCGIYSIRVLISYICSNYQIESNIIRNRRRILETDEDGMRLMPIRKLTSVSYTLDPDHNTYETYCYQLLSNWISANVNALNVENDIRPLLEAFFSSPWAFLSQLNKTNVMENGVKHDLIKNAERWAKAEETIISHLLDVLDDPGTYENDYSTRIVTVLNQVYDELYDKKIVLFTNKEETFEAYKLALSNVFSEEEVSFFGASIPQEELEVNAFRFQNKEECRIMLCDYTGGEGRNFQCADYIVHIDLPWDANMIEQRIGRLDRLERDPSRPVVTSVVVYTDDTFENALFDFWNNGLQVFTQSLSGMEIIMKDINREIIEAIQDDFKYGLFNRIPQIIDTATAMRETVRKEQNFDAAGLMYKPMFAELKRLINYYAANENDLFASTMSNWSSLAGFNGYRDRDGKVVTYTASSFSPKSALNSQLIPPRWDVYINSKQNQFISTVQEAVNRKYSVKGDARAIQGTFVRKQAIENDYLHFFAPGDDVFDCIVDNAMKSCKGTASAFAVPSEFDWCGFIFTWSAKPDETILYDHGASLYALSPYRHFLSSEQIAVPISIENKDDLTDDEIIREYNRLINLGFKSIKNKLVHFGKREREAGFLKDLITSGTNIKWFRNRYPEEQWSELVQTSRKEANVKVKDYFRKRSNIRGAREEMERTLSAKAANKEFYGMDDQTITRIREEQRLVLESIKKPRIVLESAAFVWMVQVSNENK